MIAGSDDTQALVDILVAALEAKPDEGRSFCIPDFNGPQLFVIHKGLPDGNLPISRGLLDSLVQGGILTKVEPYDSHNCLYGLTALAFKQRSARKPVARVWSVGRRAVVLVVAAIGLVAAIVTILLWAGIGPGA